MYKIPQTFGFTILWFVVGVLSKWSKILGIVVGIALAIWAMGWWALLLFAVSELAIRRIKKDMVAEESTVLSHWVEFLIGIAQVWAGWILWAFVWIFYEAANSTEPVIVTDCDGREVEAGQFPDPYPAEYHDS